MTNTYMLGGDRSPRRSCASIKSGLYATNSQRPGGHHRGKFVFSASEAIVEKGKILYPVKGAPIVGNGRTRWARPTMIGDDMALDPGVGTCGKEGQGVRWASASRRCASTA